MDSRSAGRLIEQCFPDIKVHLTRHIPTGWENFVLEVNREYVFRFPKFKETDDRLKTEIRLLSKLRNYLTTPVPDYTFVWKGGRQYSNWFGGYRKLQGITITKRTLREQSIRQIASQISKFLKELQSAENHVKRVTIPRHSKREWLRHERLQYDKIRTTVYPLLDSSTRTRSEAFWRHLFEYFAESSFEPTLLHGDLGSENILFDPKTWKITGVLDWGYAQVSDPALELSHLFHHKPEVGAEVLKMYRPGDADFETRVKWYVRSEPFYDMMWGVTHNWKNAVTLGSRHLPRSLENVD